MADLNDKKQFGAKLPESAGMTCARFEQMLMDALDGVLSPEDQSAFDLHMQHCVGCQQKMAEAQRGLAWLDMLKMEVPEPSSALLQNIFAQTSGAAVETSVSHAAHGNVIPFRAKREWKMAWQNFSRVALHPRLAMTAAMAFFSIALTMNLMGVHVTQWKVSDLRPANLRQSFYQTNAHVIRYYDNLKVVYELESRVRDLQRSNEDEPNPSRTHGDATKQDGGSKPNKPSGGSSQRQVPQHHPSEQPYVLAVANTTETMQQHARPGKVAL